MAAIMAASAEATRDPDLGRLGLVIVAGAGVLICVAAWEELRRRSK